MQDPYAQTPGCKGKSGHSRSRLQLPDSALILEFPKENKTRTNVPAPELLSELEIPMANMLGLKRVWRKVVDFGDPKSYGQGDMWGYKRVSVPRVSILDGPDPGREGNCD